MIIKKGTLSNKQKNQRNKPEKKQQQNLQEIYVKQSYFPQIQKDKLTSVLHFQEIRDALPAHEEP